MKFTLRQIAKSPGFVVVAVLSLALGIGANTAVFSLMKAVLLYTMPVRNPGELVVFSGVADENVGPPASSGWSQRDAGPGKRSSNLVFDSHVRAIPCACHHALGRVRVRRRRAVFMSASMARRKPCG